MHFYLLLITLVAAVSSFTGCAGQPVKHLASDAALINVGRSTRAEVMRYLGEPDRVEMGENGVEELWYHQVHRSTFRALPGVVSMTEPNSSESLHVTLQNNLVSHCAFTVLSLEEQGWRHDFDWENIK